ncbi:MAG TPA: tol-pal system protein YbgF [Steroidobacteraceae bacterium]|nr:tol-pal system protein YbgF [Steroidobacteraceae bacterium]
MRAELKRSAKLLPLLVVFGCATAPEQDPTVQRLAELDGRLLRIERILSNQSLLEQAQRTDAMANDIRTLRGLVEQLQHDQETARAQQRDFYNDLDKRLQAIETRSAPAAAAPSTANIPAADDDAVAYKKAFDLLRGGKYDEATVALTKFISAYPQSSLLDNAYYWLGEAHYVGKDFSAALSDFKTVIDKFPDSRKLPDAWLKIGYCHYELKDWKDSRAALKRVTQLAPDSPTAKLAEQRLAKLQTEGH